MHAFRNKRNATDSFNIPSKPIKETNGKTGINY